MKLFNRNRTKWIPLGNYVFLETDYVVFVRGNLKTGMMYFKVRRVHGWRQYTQSVLPHDLINPKKAWAELIKLMKK